MSIRTLAGKEGTRSRDMSGLTPGPQEEHLPLQASSHLRPDPTAGSPKLSEGLGELREKGVCLLSLYFHKNFTVKISRDWGKI